MTKKELLKKLLKGIETGDPDSAAVVNEEKYIQHNPQTHEGSVGLAELFARLSKTNPTVRFVRVFEDGDYAFAHNEYNFASLRAAFEVFRFEDGKAVEHWDNIQPLIGPNPSGRGMLDGETEITDLEQTETNRVFVSDFVTTVLIKQSFAQTRRYVDENLIQHSPHYGDGLDAFLAHHQAPEARIYAKLHKVLAQGNFVLCLSEGTWTDKPTSFYNLYRIVNGKIAEHWETIEKIAPRDEWKNTNGKF